jgi:hypothetical protein
MSLTGTDPFLGPINVHVNHLPGWPLSLGQVTGQPSRSFPAAGQLDVYPLIQGNFGQLVTRQGPGDAVHLEASNITGNPLYNLPPGSGADFKQPNGPITQLYQFPNLSTPVAQISQVDHSLDNPRSWQPDPPAGFDCFDSLVTARITLFPPYVPVGCTETIQMHGPFKVARSNPFDPGDGRDVINTIMACYQFVGTSLPGSCGLGTITAGVNPDFPSNGQIKALTADQNFPADSFFDIFTKIDTPAGSLHTSSPTHMTTTINSVPPGTGETYFGPGTAIPLFDQNNIQVGTLEVISHEIFASIVCPCVCEPYFKLPNKTTLRYGIPNGSLGMQYDILTGSLSALSPNWLASMAAGTCLAPNIGVPQTPDPLNPGPGVLKWYVARDGAFGKLNGTYNSCPGTTQVGNRDVEMPVAACP